jgi:hypothetical protein
MVFSTFFDKAKKQQQDFGVRKNQNHQRGVTANNDSQGSKKRKRGQAEGSQSSTQQQPQKKSNTCLTDDAATAKRQQRPFKKKNGPPSQEALHLSAQLKELSRQKNLQEALRVFRDPSNDGIRDEHHTCIVVDCCSRSGKVEVRNDHPASIFYSFRF